MMETGQFLEPLLAGETERVVKKTKAALDAGTTAEDLLKEGLIPAMGEIGEKFRNGEVYIPEVMLAARAMKAAMEVLKPILTRSSGTAAGKVVIGTAKGDLHDIGKNLVVMMMEGGGSRWSIWEPISRRSGSSMRSGATGLPLSAFRPSSRRR
jgi:5-methyltetrahydrofolate--homocysteine methyltransferase